MHCPSLPHTDAPTHTLMCPLLSAPHTHINLSILSLFAPHNSLRGFFDGVRVNSWRCLPEGAIMFVVFDMMKKGLNISQYDAK